MLVDLGVSVVDFCGLLLFPDVETPRSPGPHCPGGLVSFAMPGTQFNATVDH